jgi:hypothetical protein
MLQQCGFMPCHRATRTRTARLYRMRMQRTHRRFVLERGRFYAPVRRNGVPLKTEPFKNRVAQTRRRNRMHEDNYGVARSTVCLDKVRYLVYTIGVPVHLGRRQSAGDGFGFPDTRHEQ